MKQPNLLLRSILEHRLGLLAAIGLLATSASASTITSVSCGIQGAPYTTDTVGCYEAGTNGYVRAGVSSSVTLPAAASDAAVINAMSTASALQTTIRGITATATATSSADIGVLFDTTGPVRSGYLELNFTQTAWAAPVNGFIRESLAIGSYTVSPDGSNLTSVWIPIQLGSQFGFAYMESLTAISSSLSGLTSGAIDSQISLLAFESNQLTPVQLFDPPGAITPNLLTPEPAGFGLMIAGFSGLALMLKWRRR